MTERVLLDRDSRATGARESRILPGRLRPEEMYPARTPGVSQRFVVVGSGLRVRVLECGVSTGPPVVLLHGWCCSSYSFRRNLCALTDRGCRVVVADLKGHGLSDKPDGAGGYTLPAMADHAVEIMDAVGVARATLVGHSMGGAIALTVALRDPERVSRLALLAPVGFGAVSMLSVGRALTPRALTPLLPHLVRRWSIAGVLRLAYGRGAGITPDDVDEYFAPTQFPEFARAMRDLLHEFEWAPGNPAVLSRLAVPTLIMFGSRDRLVYRPTVEALARAIPNVALDIVEGAGHVLPEEAAERVNARLAEFVAGGGPERRVAAGAGNR